MGINYDDFASNKNISLYFALVFLESVFSGSYIRFILKIPREKEFFETKT